MEDVCMKKVYHAMLMSGGILIGDVNNYPQISSGIKAFRNWETSDLQIIGDKLA